MKTLTVKEFENSIRRRKGTTFATILAYTKPDFAGGKACPMIQKGVRKLAVVNVLIGGWSYENAVNNQRIKEATAEDVVEYFYPEKRAWGQRVLDGDRLTGLVVHEKENKKTKKIETFHYLECLIQKSISHNYYDIDGNMVPNDEAEKYLPKKEEGARQQVRNPRLVRDYMTCNVKSIKMDGTLYSIV